METVFITIHDLSPDARIKYCSDSVSDILGYHPHEVKGKSSWEYFHPDEIPFAKLVHGRGIGLDKAAVFNYCRVKHKDGHWVGCECVFTVVYDVLIASTAIYQRGPRSQSRAAAGAHVRRIFSSAPRDARYHMLSFISNKFYRQPQAQTPEPRAAFFLNRFTRSSTIMFATNGVSAILGLQPSQLVGKSFYYCIARECLDDAIRCVESAKANDSIAYLRFRYRDPVKEGQMQLESPLIGGDSDDSDLDDEDGGVPITAENPSSPTYSSTKNHHATQQYGPKFKPTRGSTPHSNVHHGRVDGGDGTDLRRSETSGNTTSQSRSSSDDSAQARQESIFETPSLPDQSSASSVAPMDDPALAPTPAPTLEMEAVISCTSDGLVLVLRRAKPLPPHEEAIATGSDDHPGIFASPWATRPILPDGMKPSDVPMAQVHAGASEPLGSGFMESIREVAVFAWSLTSINGSLIDHAHGTPSGEALPAAGLPVWDPSANVDDRTNDRYNGFATSTHRPIENGQTKPLIENQAQSPLSEKDSSDEEILWKRVPQQPPYKRPRRRAHHEAFGSDLDGDSHDADDRDLKTTKNQRRKVGKEG